MKDFFDKVEEDLVKREVKVKIEVESLKEKIKLYRFKSIEVEDKQKLEISIFLLFQFLYNSIFFLCDSPSILNLSSLIIDSYSILSQKHHLIFFT